MKPRRALISVYNKEGLDDFCKMLIEHNVEIYATPGTKKFLENRGMKVKDASVYTGFSEILGGRLKTLHTHIHAAILAKKEQIKEIEGKGIKPIDMVVCNFYPYTLGIEEMDIGGPAITRAAAKNWKRVIIISHPRQYEMAKQYLEKGFDEEVRKKLAMEALQRTAYYDAMILKHAGIEYPDILCLPYLKKQKLLKLDLRAFKKTLFASIIMAVGIIIMESIIFSVYLLPVYFVIGVCIYIIAIRALKVLNKEDIEIIKRIINSFGLDCPTLFRLIEKLLMSDKK